LRIERRIAAVVVILLATILFAGCASMSDVVKAKDEGRTKVYPVNGDQAWETAKNVFRWEGSDAIEEHRAQNYMLTSSGMNLVSMGTVMGAWIEPVDQNNTRVIVVTKRRIATNIATTLTEDTFHKRFAQTVEIVKAGKSLPIAPPN
jgi:PBP1b-binding outer membrane lipoprotein LpoB